MSLRIVPLSLAEANSFVAKHHAHHPPVVGHKFSIGVVEVDRLCGVAIASRPVARMLDDGKTFELTRVCTDRTRHAASKLIAAATRIAREMGYERGISYVLEFEAGVSYRAAGWIENGEAGGGSWHRESRPRQEPMADLLGLKPKAPTCGKRRWEWRRAA
jgi:hypothetical protein